MIERIPSVHIKLTETTSVVLVRSGEVLGMGVFAPGVNVHVTIPPAKAKELRVALGQLVPETAHPGSLENVKVGGTD